jgi:hypothetical protein
MNDKKTGTGFFGKLFLFGGKGKCCSVQVEEIEDGSVQTTKNSPVEVANREDGSSKVSENN